MVLYVLTKKVLGKMFWVLAKTEFVKVRLISHVFLMNRIAGNGAYKMIQSLSNFSSVGKTKSILF
jgi:hypothetical protein